MGFRVDITEPALADAEEYVGYIREVKREPEAADAWFLGLAESICSLEESPERCALIPEGDEFSFEIRHLIYYSHRIVFRVDHERRCVVVYRIYHGSRLGLSGYDLL